MYSAAASGGAHSGHARALWRLTAVAQTDVPDTAAAYPPRGALHLQVVFDAAAAAARHRHAQRKE